MCRKRLWCVRVRVLENHAVSREPIDCRRANGRVAVRREVIGPQGVDRDEDDRSRRGRRASTPVPGAPAQNKRHDGDNGRENNRHTAAQ
jgi:hypothetical protein